MVPEGPGATQPFGRAEAALSVAWPLRSNDRATLYADGGASFGATPPILYQFSLGGPSRLGAFGQNAFRGPNYLLGGAAYDKSLGRLPSLLGDRLYLRGLVEVGSAFERSSDAVLELSATFGLAADTFFGPLFLGASVGNGGHTRVYFLAGKVVR